MSQITFAEQSSAPTTPAASKAVVYVDNTANPRLVLKDDGGLIRKMVTGSGLLTNTSTANQTGFSTDTYLTGSSISIPSESVAVGTIYHLVFDMVKTAAGTATPILTVRYGTAGTTSDAAILTFTFGAGTAAVDTGTFEVWAHFRTVGSGTSAVLVGVANCAHALAATGLTSTGASGTGTLIVTSSGFNSTPASSIIGASFNGGASFSGTNVVVQSRLFNLGV